MRPFLLGALAAIILALAAVYGLNQIQMTTAQATVQDGTRLGPLEYITRYGRVG